MAMACQAAWRLAPVAAAAAASGGRRLPGVCRAVASKAKAAKAPEPVFTFEAAAAEPPLFPELLQPGRRAVLLAIDPDLGGAVAALTWRNPPAAPQPEQQAAVAAEAAGAGTPSGGSDSSSSGSSGSSGRRRASSSGGPGDPQQAAAALPAEALLASPGLRIELHDMPVEVWRYGTRDKRQPAADGLIRIIRQYAGTSSGGWGAEGAGGGGDGAVGGAIGVVKKRRRKAAPAGAAVAADAGASPSSSNGSGAAAAAAAGKEEGEEEEAPIVRAVMEYNLPSQVSGKYAWFGIGFAVGVLNGLLTAAGVPFHRVHASTWKAQLALRRQGKEGSIALARHLLPAAADDLRRKKDHGRAEALLIGAWALGARMQSVTGGSDAPPAAEAEDAEDE